MMMIMIMIMMMLTIFIFSLSLHLSRAHTYAFKCITQMTVRLSNIEGTNPNPDVYVSCAGTNYSSTKTAKSEGEAVQLRRRAPERIYEEILFQSSSNMSLVRDSTHCARSIEPGRFSTDLFKLDTEIIITWKPEGRIKCNTRMPSARAKSYRSHLSFRE